MRRARRTLWRVAAGSLVAVAAGCALTGLSGCGATQSTVGAVSWQGEQGPAVVSAGGRVLTVPGATRFCGGAATLVARQGVTQVALWVRDVAMDDAPGACSLAMSPPPQVRLAAPLGTRKLVNGATGEPIPRFTAPLLLSAYQLWQVDAQPAGPSDHAVPGVQLTYTHYGQAGDLVVTMYHDSPFVPWPWQPGAGEHLTRIRVRGVPGWASDFMIGWRQQGLVSTVDIQPPTEAGGPLLSTAELIAIADSAPI
jgi:hypothetical protein